MVIGKDILPENSLLFVCDVQEKFRQHGSHFQATVEAVRRLIDVSYLLEIPVIVSEQYPKGLGETVQELNLSRVAKKYEKSMFTMIIPELELWLQSMPYANRKCAILCGLETHVCVLQSALDLMAKGFEVYVVADGCTSRSTVDRMFALQRLEKAGCIVTTYESVVLQLVRHKDHPQFKAVQNIIRTLNTDSGLILNKL